MTRGVERTQTPADRSGPVGIGTRLRRAVVRVVGSVVRLVGRAVVLILTTIIRLYQLTVSPMLAPTCRYHPSCSRYAVAALRTHGALKGSLLAAWRLGRCHPWTPGGLDPVPEVGAWRPAIQPDGTPRTVASGGDPGATDPGRAGHVTQTVPAEPVVRTA